MTRFAKGDLDLSGIRMTGGPRSSAADASGNVNVGDAFQSLSKRAPRYDNMAADWITDRAEIENAAMTAEAAVYQQGLKSAGDVYAAKVKGEAAEEAAKAAASAQKTGSTIGAIASIATAGIGLLSDETTKDTIERIDDALSTLRELKPVTFHYKEEFSTAPERMHYGFIAQDYQKVMPDATYFDESIGKLCIDPGELISLLVRANQQLEARIARLEAKQVLAGVK